MKVYIMTGFYDYESTRILSVFDHWPTEVEELRVKVKHTNYDSYDIVEHEVTSFDLKQEDNNG